MKTDPLTIDVVSVPDREELVAELWLGEHQVAELSQDKGDLKLQIFRPPSGKWWEFNHREFTVGLAEMERRLRN